MEDWKRAAPPAWRHVFFLGACAPRSMDRLRTPEQGRKCASRDNFAGKKFPLRRHIAVDPRANSREYPEFEDRHAACLRYRATLAPTTDGTSDDNLFCDGFRPDHKLHVPANRRLIRVRQRQRDHVAGQQRGAGFSRLRQDVPGGTDAREYPEEPWDDRAAVRKALAGATAGRESEDPADHAATDAAKRGQNRPACERLRLRCAAQRRQRGSGLRRWRIRLSFSKPSWLPCF